jgi:hypothetical protein
MSLLESKSNSPRALPSSFMAEVLADIRTLNLSRSLQSISFSSIKQRNNVAGIQLVVIPEKFNCYRSKELPTLLRSIQSTAGLATPMIPPMSSRRCVCTWDGGGWMTVDF